MKKYTILTILIYLNSLLFSQIDFNYAIEVGYMPRSFYQESTPKFKLTSTDISNQFTISFEPELIFYSVFRIGGLAKIYMRPNSIISFHPVGLSSYIFADINLNNFSIGIRHECTHPVATLQANFGNARSYYVDKSYTEIYIRYSSKKY